MYLIYRYVLILPKHSIYYKQSGVTRRNPFDYVFRIATLQLYYRLVCGNILHHTADYYWMYVYDTVIKSKEKHKYNGKLIICKQSISNRIHAGDTVPRPRSGTISSRPTLRDAGEGTSHFPTHTHTHARTRAFTHARTHARTHTRKVAMTTTHWLYSL